MAKFKVIEKEMVVMASEYTIEAESKEEAIEKYVNELAGSIEPDDNYISHGKPGVY